MFLYHHTNTSPDKILKEGLCCFFKKEDTENINKVLNKLQFHPNWFDRNYCLFFRMKKILNISNYIVTVNTINLLKEDLYVAEENYAQQILDSINSGEEKLLKNLAEKYWSSIIKFGDYIDKNIEYKRPEIIYLHNIPPQYIHYIEKVK